MLLLQKLSLNTWLTSCIFNYKYLKLEKQNHVLQKYENARILTRKKNKESVFVWYKIIVYVEFC